MRFDDRGQADSGFLAAVVATVRRRWRWGGGVTLVVFGLAVAVLFLARPVYRADARLRLGEPPPTAGLSPTGGLLSFLRTGGDPFSNDLELLSSRTLAETVVGQVALSVSLRAPKGWHRDSIFEGLSLQDTTIKATYEVTWESDGGVRVERSAPRDSLVGRFAPGEPAVFGGLRATFAPRRPSGPESVRLKTVPLGEAVRVESSRIQVRRTRREANVLEIVYTHDDPGIASQVVASAVESFLTLRTRLFQRESGETVDSLRAVALGTQEELRVAEDALEETQRRTGLIAPDAQSEALIDRFESIYEGLAEAKAERDAVERQLTRVGQTDDRIVAWSTLVAHPRFLENETAGVLLQRLTLLEDTRTELLSSRQPESRALQTLELQIGQSELALRTLVGEYHTALTASIEELETRMAEMERLIGALPAQAVEFGRRQRTVRILSEVTVLTEQRLRQEELRQALAFSNVQIIDDPALRFRPVWPRKKLGAAVGLLLACGAGLLAIVTVERADTSVRRAAWIRAVTDAPILATLVDGAETRANESRSVGDALRGGAALVPCWGAGRRLDSVSLEVGSREEVPLVRIEGYTDAKSLSQQGRPAILLLRVGRTRRADVQLVVSHLREAGCDIKGSAVECRSAAEELELWS